MLDVKPTLEINPTLNASLFENAEINLVKGNMVKIGKVVNNFPVASNETPDKGGIQDGEVCNSQLQEALDSGNVPSKVSVVLNEDDKLGLSELGKFPLNARITITYPAELAYLAFAEYYADRGLHSLALWEWDRAIFFHPNNKHLRTMRSASRFLTKDLNGAWEDANKAVDLDNKYAYGYFHRSIMNLSLGNKEDAAQDYSEARRLAELQGDKETLDLINELKPKEFE